MAARKVAIVTGSNKGIGLAIVRGLCPKFNGDVFLTSRNEERGQAAAKELKTKFSNLKYHQLDIDDVESIKKLRSDIVSEYRGIDILINNAGIAFKSEDTTPVATQAKVILKTNFFSTLDASKILLPEVRSNGRVINISGFVSVSSLGKCSSALQCSFRSDTITEEELVDKMNEYIEAVEAGNEVEKGWPKSGYGASYGVSKIGVTVLSRIHARQLQIQGKKDILLNACCPGWVRTDMAGPKATKSPDEGAETPLYLALLPAGATEPHGQFVSDKKVRKW